MSATNTIDLQSPSDGANLRGKNPRLKKGRTASQIALDQNHHGLFCPLHRLAGFPTSDGELWLNRNSLFDMTTGTTTVRLITALISFPGPLFSVLLCINYSQFGCNLISLDNRPSELLCIVDLWRSNQLSESELTLAVIPKSIASFPTRSPIRTDDKLTHRSFDILDYLSNASFHPLKLRERFWVKWRRPITPIRVTK